MGRKWLQLSSMTSVQQTSYFSLLDITLCLMSYKMNNLFIAAIKHNNILTFPYFNCDMLLSFSPSFG